MTVLSEHNKYFYRAITSVVVVLMLAAISSRWASAASQPTHPADENEFVGYWRILLIDNDRHKSAIKNEDTNYTDPCQFLVHKADGVWMNITVTTVDGEKATKDNCPTQKSEIDKHAAIATAVSDMSRQSFKWSKLRNQNGLFYIVDKATNNGLLWKVDFVAEDLPAVEKIGFELKKGDMIMQIARLLGPGTVAPVWPMVLRPVPQ